MPRSRPTAALRPLVRALQSYTVFKGLTSLVYAGLWLWWLHTLGAKLVAGDDSNDNNINIARNVTLTCRDVAPTLRRALYVLAWVGAVGTALFACGMGTRLLLAPSAHAVAITFASAAIVALYAYQIQYIERVARSERPLGDGQCALLAPWRRQLVLAFAMAIGLFGLLSVGFGVWGGGAAFEGLVRAARKDNA